MAAYRDAAAAHAKRYGPASLVAFIDAYDALCVRDAAGLAEAFRKFNKPLLIGLEAGCLDLGHGNCGHIEKYWMLEHGSIPTRPNRFANGGFIMGEAHAVAEAYGWMLAEGHSDDQIGLADFVNTHSVLVAADETSRVILNAYWAEERSGKPMGASAWFVHFAGLKETPTWMRYAETVKEHAGPFAIAIDDITTSKKWFMNAYNVLALALVICVVAWIAYSAGTLSSRISNSPSSSSSSSSSQQ